MIPIFSNTLGAEELAAVGCVFESRWLGVGKECAAFESELAQYWGVDKSQVLLHNCCTAAIYNALRSIGIGQGDEVILSTGGFVACLSAVLELGAIPVFADVDSHTMNIIPDEIIRLRSRRTRAVVILHYGGHPSPMKEVLDACGDVPLIEDSANSIASRYDGKACGTLGTAGTWSFDAMKILVCGDGGALWIKPDYVGRAKRLRYLGLDENMRTGIDRAGTGVSRWWEFGLVEPAGRFVSNDIAASIGRVQLRKLSGFIARRKEIWETFQRELATVGDIITPPEPLPGCESSYYLYWIQTGVRDALALYLKSEGIYTTFRYYPLHMACGDRSMLPGAEYANQRTLNLPLHQNLTDDDVGRIIDAIKGFFG